MSGFYPWQNPCHLKDNQIINIICAIKQKKLFKNSDSLVLYLTGQSVMINSKASLRIDWLVPYKGILSLQIVVLDKKIVCRE